MNLIKSPLSYALNKAGVPTLANGGKPPKTIKAVKFSPTGIPQQYVQYVSDPTKYSLEEGVIEAYRANPKNRFGAKDFIETQSTNLNSNQINAYMKALRDAQHFGVKPLTPEQLATMALIEGRSDLGYDMFNYNNPKAVKLADMLTTGMGHDPQAAGFAAAILDKQQQAERTGIPFTTLWNGTGRGTGGTGADYTKRYNAAYNTGAYEHPKNSQLYEAIATGLLPDPIKATMPQVDAMGNPTGMKSGGSVAEQKAFLKFKKK